MNTLETLGRVLNHVRASQHRADAIALTGDLIHDAGADAYDHFPRLLGRSGVPVLCVPGNHDDRAAMASSLAVEPFRYCGTVDLGGWSMIGLDSCVDGAHNGYLTEVEFERLTNWLSTTRAEHLAVCLHHPPLPLGSAWLDTVRLDNGERLLDRLAADARVRLLLFGHAHQDFEQDHAAIRIIGTPSTCRQFLPLSDDFAVDDQPPAYRWLRLNDDGRVVSELVWVST